MPCSRRRTTELTYPSIIVNSFGFTTLQTTLLGCVDGIIESESTAINALISIERDFQL